LVDSTGQRNLLASRTRRKEETNMVRTRGSGLSDFEQAEIW
jgi:hypothetical protein